MFFIKVNLLNENYTFWAGDITHRVVYDFARELQVTGYPYLAVILPTGSTDYRVLHTLSGRNLASIDGLIALLTQGIEDLNHHRGELVQNMGAVEEGRFIRDEQDREYQEALAADRRREEQKAKDDAEKSEKEAIEAAERASIRQAEDNFQDIRKQKAQNLRSEPAAGEPMSKLMVRLKKKTLYSAQGVIIYILISLYIDHDLGLDISVRCFLSVCQPA